MIASAIHKSFCRRTAVEVGSSEKGQPHWIGFKEEQTWQLYLEFKRVFSKVSILDMKRKKPLISYNNDIDEQKTYLCKIQLEEAAKEIRPFFGGIFDVIHIQDSALGG